MDSYTLGVASYTLGVASYSLGVASYTLGVASYTLGVVVDYSHGDGVREVRVGVWVE